MPDPPMPFEFDGLPMAPLGARMEANLLGAPAIAPKHVQLALVHERAGLARRLLSDLSIQQARELVAPGVTIQMKAKAASDLVLARYDPVVHPEFAGMLAELPHLRGAADHAVIFTNASSEPLTSIVARWTVVDPGGTFRNKDIVHDDYSHLRHNRVQLLGLPDDSIAPGARLLVTTKGFSKALDVSRAHCGVFAGPLNYHSLENDAAEIRVSLDSAVYPDGRLVGPDIFGIGHYLQSRYKAAQEVVHRIDEAVAAGEDVDAVLRDLADKSGTPDLRWHRMFAASATTRGPERKPGYVGWLESARRMPKPPELYRDGELRSS